MTALPPKGGKGYKVDPDKMREALKLAQSMYDELEERGGDVPDLVGIVSPAGDDVSNKYTVGQKQGARIPASAATQAYGEAYNAQLNFLGQLIPNLQSALASYEADDAAAAEGARRTADTV